MKKKFFIILSYLIIFFNFNLSSEEESNKLKVGLLVPLSGDYKDLGNSFLYSLQLALDEIDDKNIIIIPRDSGINNKKIVFKSNKPFHAERFWNFIQNEFPHNIIRSKGLFWLDSRPNQALTWGQAGGSLKADSAGVWWASMPLSVRVQFQNFVYAHKVK